MIEFLSEEKENFIKVIDELIKQVDDCILRDKRTKFGKISTKGTTNKLISDNLQFLTNKYQYSFKIGIGNAGGFLNDEAWIMFVRNDLLKEDLINGKKITPTKGIYIFIAYSGYFQNNKHLVLEFGFPEGDIENSRCIAVDKIEREGYLQRFNFTYNLDDKDKLLKDFSEMMNYFNSLGENDFKIYEVNKKQDEYLKIKSDNSDIKNQQKTNKNSSSNQILYGPPGTGKTYHTIDKALEIILKEEKIQIPSEDDRVNRKKLFDEYIKNGQIVFTTFHQSYGYEEFVEGIKPVMDSEQGNSKEVEYEIKDGVFKELCKKANKNYLSSNENNNELDLDKLIFEFANYINQNFINKGDEFPLENRVNIKEILLNSKGEYRSFLLGGSIKSPQRLTIDIIKRDYLNFKENKILDYKDIKPKYESQSDYHGNAIYYFMFYKKLKEFENTQNVSFKNINEKLKPYIIIIDEINRGNVSKIFGELITLIEPSKRIGESEELKITLPYSGEKFGVPKNVYIIGTMNTADRSITSLDTALRRRFEFVEMMPDASKLSTDCKGVNLQELLQAINTRIEYLLDREKTIGHAFFIGIDSLEKLKNVFQNKIIPLLQEYFYNDYALIDAVLNDNGMIFEDKKDNKYLQKIKNLDNVDNEKNIYNITPFNDEIWDKPETYQAIYDDKKNKTKNDEQ
ncbi:AAA family ATPase [Campylobacter jejuni]|nr:AAA family ATPase [Campylobacter jejuni]